MYRLIKDWEIDGLKISSGIAFKEKPKIGVLSRIPDEYFEEFEPVSFAKRSRKTGKNSTQSTQKEKTIEENARIGDCSLI